MSLVLSLGFSAIQGDQSLSLGVCSKHKKLENRSRSEKQSRDIPNDKISVSV